MESAKIVVGVTVKYYKELKGITDNEFIELLKNDELEEEGLEYFPADYEHRKKDSQGDIVGLEVKKLWNSSYNVEKLLSMAQSIYNKFIDKFNLIPEIYIIGHQD